jgi:purine-binding chemotaxis protein CheW
MATIIVEGLEPTFAALPFENGNAEFLTFTIAGVEYGIDILKVKEIRGFETVTKIVNTPPFMIGVINLRGVIVPIVDLRMKFKLGAVAYDQFTVVIILNIAGRLIGIVVDSVSDVISLSIDQIRPAPKLGTSPDLYFIIGVGVTDNSMIILADIERLLSFEELALFDKAVGQ